MTTPELLEVAWAKPPPARLPSPSVGDPRRREEDLVDGKRVGWLIPSHWQGSPCWEWRPLV
jgi:hypothetical protein